MAIFIIECNFKSKDIGKGHTYYTKHYGSFSWLSLIQVVKELDVSLFQAMVLLLFNDKTEWTYVDVFEQLKIGKI